MVRTLLVIVLVGTLVSDARAGEPAAFQPLDYAKVDRTIRREPAYVSAPRYALFVFDGAATYRVWAVLDRSKADAPEYDVLYLDRNGDGDLTQPGERLEAVIDPKLEEAGIDVTFRVGDVVVPATGEKHTDFLISSKPKKGRQGIWFRLHWRGKTEISGGYGTTGTDTTLWGTSAATAPILRPTAEGPLSFATYGAKDLVLTEGADLTVNVLVGHRGSGADSLCVVDETFLDLEKEHLVVTVIAKGKHGNHVSERFPIHEHC